MTAGNSIADGPVYRIEGDQTIADVEREIAEIAARPRTRLLLPVRPKKWWFGGEAALIQLLITWGKLCPDATLVTHVGEHEDPTLQLSHLVGRAFGFVAVWMARDVADRSQRRALKVLANKLSEKEIDLMWFGRRRRESLQPSLFGDEGPIAGSEIASVGDRVFLASIDHQPRWRIPAFYFPSGEVRHRDDFVSLADTMARKATSGRGGSPITPEVRGPLGAILHELLKNTHAWARTDEFGVPLLRSARGLIAQGHSWAESEALDVAKGSPALGAYLSEGKLRSPEGRWRFLELSVFDSGPGLAKRWLSGYSGGIDRISPGTLEDEYRACMECFLRWNSSSGAGHKGVGLHEVMRVLSDLNAFMRVRTGRLALYRDFIARPYAGRSSEDCSFNDWTTQSNSLTALGRAEGVLYTMLIPIRGRNA